MTFTRWIILLALGMIGIIATFSFLRSAPPEVPFGKVTRQELVSSLVTNGQADPRQSSEIRTLDSGTVASLFARQGDTVTAGQQLLKIDVPGARSHVADARSSLEAAEERLRELKAGGPPKALADLDANIEAARLELQTAIKASEGLARLVQKQAAAPEELRRQNEQISLLRARLDGLTKQRAVVVTAADISEAESSVMAARTALAEAERIVAQRTVRSPVSGTLFELNPRAGAWLNPGDLVGKVGDLSSIRVSVFVDEPELGKVKLGLPVTIRWDAKPGQTWTGKVNELPSRVQPFGTRQVGEVISLIANPDRELLPGTNVNVEIETARVASALVIPKQALRRRGDEDGVWKLVGDVIHWQPIEVGISNATSAQVTNGLVEGDSIVLIYDRELSEGMPAKPVYP